ncbi:MAG: Sec-independent protein translocase protein TatB [Porticoccaceae bacterium]
MFDIGFAELVVIAVIALVVMGPQRLPTAMRFIALWLGRIRRQYRKIRQDLEDEIGLDEVRRQLHNENILKELEENKSRPDTTPPQKSDTSTTDSQER